MRGLIRPALFMIARLGLFLAVAAWIVAQWQEAKCYILLAGIELEIGNCTRGWKFEYADFTQGTKFQLVLVPDPVRFDTLRFGEDYPRTMDILKYGGVRPIPASISTNVAGVVVGEVWRQGFLTLKHWLVVGVFALFNVVLMFIYHKRPEAQPCEV